MKCVCGNPMREHVISLDDVWWICIICGRQKPSGQELPSTAADTNNTSDTSDLLNENQASVKENNMGKTATCVTCKRKNMSIAAAGECGRCYGRRRAGRDPLTNEPIDAVPAATKVNEVDNVGLLSIQKPTTETLIPAQEATPEQHPGSQKKRAQRPYPTPEHITLPFVSTRDADLFAKLQTLAATHRRTLEAEILFQLEDRVMQIEDIYLSKLDNKEICHG